MGIKYKKNITGIILALEIFCLSYSSNNENNLPKVERQNYSFNCDQTIPENVRQRAENLTDFPFREKPVLVRVSKCINYYILTSKNGYHVGVLAERVGLPAPVREIPYENYDTAFSQQHESFLSQRIPEMDKNKDQIIDIDEIR